MGLRPAIADLKQTGGRQFVVRYHWTVEKAPVDAYRVFVHFTDNSGAIKFQNDYEPSPSLPAWKPGEVLQGPFTVTVPDGLTGTFNIRVGIFKPGSEERALLQGRDDGNRSYYVGKLRVSIHHNLFEGTGQRVPRVRYGQVNATENSCGNVCRTWG